MNSKLTNKKLKNMFLIFNARFFDSKIATDTRVSFIPLKEDGRASRQRGIEINKDLTKHPDLATLVLFHEMIHLYLDTEGYIGHEHDAGHGSRFHVEIDKLYQKGAYEGLLILPFLLFFLTLWKI